MGKYVYYSEEQKLRADDVDLEDFLRQQGETLIRSGRDLRLKSDHSVTIRGNEWFDHATQKGGHPVTFIQRHYGLSYPEAMRLLLGGEQGRTYARARDIAAEEPKPFALPPANDNMRRTFAYLIKQRHIDPDVISTFAKNHVLYEDKPYHNAVFVGRDENGMARHAHKRSTNSYGKTFRINIDGSDPRYSFHHIGKDGSLFVFEAPIDLMSFATMFPYDWQDHSYVACCGTSCTARRAGRQRKKFSGPSSTFPSRQSSGAQEKSVQKNRALSSAARERKGRSSPWWTATISTV